MAQGIVCEQAPIVANDHRGSSLYLLRLSCPPIAAALEPGQFVHLQVPGMPERILRRPFSVYRTAQDGQCIDILYQVVGLGTARLAKAAPGQAVSLIGPLGSGWALQAPACAVLVGGGVGAAPLLMLADKLHRAGAQVHVVLGAQTKDALVTYDDFCTLGLASVTAATDDGSFGHAGFCTQPALDAIGRYAPGFVACCGPEPLMRIMADAARQVGVACQVSMERRMACGVGACLSCVVDTSEGRKRCCVDGPVFDAEKVVW